MSSKIYDIQVRRISGTAETLGTYEGSVALIVNVASKCGLTPQYEGLQKLYRKYHDRGLVVLAFPANDFAGQEPGTNQEIESFCQSQFGVEFPIYEKISVAGDSIHPLYRELISRQPNAVDGSDVPFREKLKGYGKTPNPEPEVVWNFEKFLLSRSGDVVARFAPDVTPDNPMVVNAIERELANG
jgi:glutathione peroxidase